MDKTPIVTMAMIVFNPNFFGGDSVLRGDVRDALKRIERGANLRIAGTRYWYVVGVTRHAIWCNQTAGRADGGIVEYLIDNMHNPVRE